jgi:hypothetical protein
MSLSPFPFFSAQGVLHWKRRLHEHPRWAYGGIAFLLALIVLASFLILRQKQERPASVEVSVEPVLPTRILVLTPVQKKSENLQNKYIIKTTPAAVSVKLKMSTGTEQTRTTPLELTLAEGESCELLFSHEGYRDSTISLRFDPGIVVREIYQDLVPVVVQPPDAPQPGKGTAKPPSSKGMRHERRKLGDGVL